MADFFTNKHHDYPDTKPTQQVLFTGQVPSVSFSTLSTFEQCPYAVYLNKVVKIQGISGPAADRGSKLHELLEQYVLGNTSEINWKAFKAGDYHAPIIDSFRAAHSAKPKSCVPELLLAFKKDLSKCKWDAKDVWLRGAIDVALFDGRTKATLYDYKSGSNSSAAKHRAQLMLYALLMFIRYPKLETIRVAAMYLDLKLDVFYTNYTRSDVDLYWPRYLARLQAVTNCDNFQPNPNGFTCKWCQHKKVQTDLLQVVPACEFAYVG